MQRASVLVVQTCMHSSGRPHFTWSKAPRMPFSSSGQSCQPCSMKRCVQLSGTALKSPMTTRPAAPTSAAKQERARIIWETSSMRMGSLPVSSGFRMRCTDAATRTRPSSLSRRATASITRSSRCTSACRGSQSSKVTLMGVPRASKRSRRQKRLLPSGDFARGLLAKAASCVAASAALKSSKRSASTSERTSASRLRTCSMSRGPRLAQAKLLS
mmetsp:Transcript_40866/g.129850  ORF Transcript_40866/g.129850 Transcript_40866/m.129850 type:complete len:215 (-) Transcript_40866:75-719(-)